MSAPRMLARAAVGLAPLLLVVLAATPAAAHGASQNPVSRAAACGPEGGRSAQSAACQAAVAASGPTALAAWDNIRVADVAGRDQEAIPDGQLCSAGLPEYAGLDLTRTDWPTTELTAGADLTFTYRTTIPHRGTFRWYVTKDGYDPAQPLTWADLEPRPFLTVKDPPIVDGAYTMAGQLPAAKTGRHLIYTVWQNSSTPDTYYSCSDVVFADGGASTAVAATPTSMAAAPAAEESSDPNTLPLVAAAGVALTALAATAGAVIVVRRRRS